MADDISLIPLNRVENLEDNLNNAVHKTGNETIGGVKTFTSPPQFNPGNGIRINTDSEYYTIRSMGPSGSTGGLHILLNNTTSALDITPTYMTVGSSTILPRTVTPSTSDNSARIATTEWVNTSTNVVHRTGNESIAGEKTFTALIYQETSNTSAGAYTDFIQKINGARKGTIRTTYNSDGSYKITLGNNGPDSAAPVGISVYRNSSSYWTEAPTPSTSDNSTKIATTAFVNSRIIDIMNSIYPVNSLYLTLNDTNPASLFGFGTWVKVSEGRVIQGADSNHAAGTTAEAGLPNITGETITQVNTNSPEGGSTRHINPVSGAFESSSVSYGTMNGGSSMTSTYYAGNFNASRCSSIYGNSDTVQPPAFFVNIWLRTN